MSNKNKLQEIYSLQNPDNKKIKVMVLEHATDKHLTYYKAKQNKLSQATLNMYRKELKIPSNEELVYIPMKVISLNIEIGAVGFKQKLKELTSIVEFMLIDTPPQLATAAMLAALLGDILLIPVMPGAYDIWATEAVIKMGRDACEKPKSKHPILYWL